MNSGPRIIFFGHVSPDSTRVLGIGLSMQTAYQDALKRHGGRAEGYSVKLTLSDFPPNTRPDAPVIHALDEAFPISAAEGEPLRVESAPPKKAASGKPTKPKLEPVHANARAANGAANGTREHAAGSEKESD